MLVLRLQLLIRESHPNDLSGQQRFDAAVQRAVTDNIQLVNIEGDGACLYFVLYVVVMLVMILIALRSVLLL